MSICPTVSVRCFYGCCHPCSVNFKPPGPKSLNSFMHLYYTKSTFEIDISYLFNNNKNNNSRVNHKKPLYGGL